MLIRTYVYYFERAILSKRVFILQMCEGADAGNMDAGHWKPVLGGGGEAVRNIGGDVRPPPRPGPRGGGLGAEYHVRAAVPAAPAAVPTRG